MKTIILCGLLAALALVFVPPERSVAKQTEDVVLLIEEPAAASALSAAPSADEPEARTVQLKTEDGVETVDEDTYLTAVVLSEMPASFEPEALAAQAVAQEAGEEVGRDKDAADVAKVKALVAVGLAGGNDGAARPAGTVVHGVFGCHGTPSHMVRARPGARPDDAVVNSCISFDIIAHADGYVAGALS